MRPTAVSCEAHSWLPSSIDNLKCKSIGAGDLSFEDVVAAGMREPGRGAGSSLGSPCARPSGCVRADAYFARSR